MSINHYECGESGHIVKDCKKITEKNRHEEEEMSVIYVISSGTEQGSIPIGNDQEE